MSMLRNGIVISTLMVLGFVAPGRTCAAQQPPPPESSWAWDATEKHVVVPSMTNIIYFTFWVTNRSDKAAQVLHAEADCDCTVIEAREAFPWTIPPGESGALTVRINTRGRFGEVQRPVLVHSSAGSQRLIASMNIPLSPAPANMSARQQDVQIALSDRQAVFRGRCAPCHALPAVNLTGAPLFEKACGICHSSKHRAEIVPDLSRNDGQRDAEYWRRWITQGKAGSLMPAFGTSEGGILDTRQIESLVDYLLKRFPSAITNSADNPLESAAKGVIHQEHGASNE